jgi:hypothetical protein
LAWPVCQKQSIYDNKLKELIVSGTMTKDTLVWKTGMANWDNACNQIELVSLFNSTPPPPPTK